MYILEHDGTGWQLTPESETPHAYVVDDDLRPVDTIQAEHSTMQLLPGNRYVITQDAGGTWSLTVSAVEPTVR